MEKEYLHYMFILTTTTTTTHTLCNTEILIESALRIIVLEQPSYFLDIKLVIITTSYNLHIGI